MGKMNPHQGDEIRWSVVASTQGGMITETFTIVRVTSADAETLGIPWKKLALTPRKAYTKFLTGLDDRRFDYDLKAQKAAKRCRECRKQCSKQLEELENQEK